MYDTYAGLGKKQGMENFKSAECAAPVAKHGPPASRAPRALTAHPARTPCSFKKFCKDAGLWKDKGNKFNIKPPNRVRYSTPAATAPPPRQPAAARQVDFVFTYACTQGPGGCKGNKNMEFGQFEFAMKGARVLPRPLAVQGGRGPPNRAQVSPRSSGSRTMTCWPRRARRTPLSTPPRRMCAPPRTGPALAAQLPRPEPGGRRRAQAVRFNDDKSIFVMP